MEPFKGVAVANFRRSVIAASVLLPSVLAGWIFLLIGFSWLELVPIAICSLMLPGLALGSITLYAHREQTHHSIELARPVQMICRFLVFLFGMVVRQWVGVHLTHHKFSDRLGDPHSPVIHGFWRVAYNTAGLFHEAKNRPDILALIETLPTDKWDRRLFDKAWRGPVFFLPIIQLGILFACFGLSFKVFAVAFAWPFAILFFLWAGGAVNAIGHTASVRAEADLAIEYLGDYSSHEGIIFGFLTMGELSGHDDHHRDPDSAKFCRQAWRDLGWCLIVALRRVGWASVNHVHVWI